ncbi:MAG: hypothetical protein ACRCSF_12070 [Mycobacteriaceae bacterium]
MSEDNRLGFSNSASSQWNSIFRKSRKSGPAKLFGGRIRVTTLILMVTFIVIYILYQLLHSSDKATPKADAVATDAGYLVSLNLSEELAPDQNCSGAKCAALIPKLREQPYVRDLECASSAHLHESFAIENSVGHDKRCRLQLKFDLPGI